MWIVDPLDGTRKYSEPGRVDWAVHIALVENGVPVAGAVALPAVKRTLTTRPAPAPPPARHGAVRLVVSRTRPPLTTGLIQARLGAQLVCMGSAGAKAMSIVSGEADVYAHAGGQYE